MPCLLVSRLRASSHMFHAEAACTSHESQVGVLPGANGQAATARSKIQHASTHMSAPEKEDCKDSFIAQTAVSSSLVSEACRRLRRLCVCHTSSE